MEVNKEVTMVTIKELAARVSKRLHNGDKRDIPLIAHEVCLGFPGCARQVLSELARHRKPKLLKVEQEHPPKKPPSPTRRTKRGEQMLFPFPERKRIC